MAETAFAKQLLNLRKKKGITQEQLAGVLGVSAQAVSKWENGSFPEGDLLPRLADYFEVSIDYLYGREKDEVSLEQQIVDEMEKIGFSTMREGAELYFDRCLDLNWATHIGSWSNKAALYYDRPSYEAPAQRIASLLTSEQGFAYERLNKTLEYHFVMKEPEGGFASFFQPTPELAKAFAFLGDEDNLKVLFFLLALNDGECVEVSVAAKRTGVKEEKVEKAFKQLLTMMDSGNRMLQKVAILTEQGDTRPAYTCVNQTGCSFLTVLAGMDFFLNPPSGFQLQVGCRQSPWMRERKEAEGK